MGGAALLVACASIIGLEASTNATDSRDVGLPVPPVDPCTHAGPPANDDRGVNGDSLPLLVAAAREIKVASDSSGDAVVGYDLDGVCTCGATTDPAVPGKPSCKGSPVTCDGPGTGIDNGLQSFFNAVGKDVNGALPFACAVDTGQVTVLYGLSNYNGDLNDPQIVFSHVSAVPSVGTDGMRVRPFAGANLACETRRLLMGADAGADAGPSAGDAGGEAGPPVGDAGVADPGAVDASSDASVPHLCAAPGSVPAWHGCDEWYIQRGTDQLITRSGSLDVPQVGYVRNGRLVVPALVPQEVHLGDFRLTLRDGFFTADIELVDDLGRPVAFGGPEVKAAIATALPNGEPHAKMSASTVRMRLRNGMFAGRVDPAEVFLSVALSVGDFGGVQGIRLCQSPVGRILLDQARPLLCNTRDLAAERARDNQDQPCTMSSFAFRFSGEPAYPGAVRDPPPDPRPKL